MAAQVELRLSTHARKAFESLARNDHRLLRRLDRAIERLREEPLAGKPLQGPLQGHRSLRVGELRIVYRFEPERQLVLVLSIAPRGQVYRDL